MITKINKIFAAGLVCCGLVATMTGCSDNDPSVNLKEAVMPTAIEFNLPDDLQQLIYQDELGADVLPLIKGQTVTLRCRMVPEDITFEDVTWSSSNTAYATVDAYGTVNAINGGGYTIISVAPYGYAPSNTTVRQSLKVKVDNEVIPATALNVTASDTQVYAGETITVKASVVPSNATYQTVKWSSSDESIATVDAQGVVTGMEGDGPATVTIIGTTLDGSDIVGSIDILVKQIVQPEDVSIDQSFAAPNYYCAIAEKSVQLAYTTFPEDCTTSLIEWSSSDETIATVENGIVTFNQDGNFGDFTITATCPATGATSEVKMTLAEGLVRETFHNQDNYTWYDSKQSGSGTATATDWFNGHVTITTYTVDATTQRADIKCYALPTWLHAGNFPIFAVKMDDVKDLGEGITSRNINIDAVGKSASGDDYKAIANGNNKYLHDYKCSDGSHVFIYDLATQACGTGGLMPQNESVKFTTLQIKYADMKTVDHQVKYNLYWVQTFKTLEDVQNYIEQVDRLSYEVIK